MAITPEHTDAAIAAEAVRRERASITDAERAEADASFDAFAASLPTSAKINDTPAG